MRNVWQALGPAALLLASTLAGGGSGAEDPPDRSTAIIDVLVVDESTMAPIAGASVSLQEESWGDSRQLATVRTIANGHASLQVSRVPTNGRVRACAPGKSPGFLSWETPPSVPGPYHLLLPLGAGHALTGHVTDAKGLPVSGAGIQPGWGEDFSPAQTDADGRFILEDVPLRPIRLLLVADGFAAREIADVFPHTPGLRIALQQATPVVVRIVDAARQEPLRSAVLAARWGSSGVSVTQGPRKPGESSELRVPRGEGDSLTLYVRAPDSWDFEHEIRAPVPDSVTVQMLSAAGNLSIEGWVRNERTGSPVDEAEVSLELKPLSDATHHTPGSGRYRLRRTVTTTGTGRFRFAELPPSSAGLFVRGVAGAYDHPGESTTMELREGSTAREVELVVTPRMESERPWPVAHGRVVLPDGTPVACALVIAWGSDSPGPTESGASWGGYIGLDGRFEVRPSATHRHFALQAYAPGLGRASFGPMELSAELLQRGMTLTLQRGVRITGRVLDDCGSPLVGAEISLHGENGADERPPNPAEGSKTWTDPSGRFAFPEVLPGCWWLRAGHPDCWGAGARLVAIEGEGERDLGDLCLVPGGFLEGTLTDAEGRPVAQEFIRASSLLGPPWFDSARTDAAGRFSFRRIPRRSRRVRLTIDSRPASIVLASRAEVPARGLVLRLPSEGPADRAK
ncbi:MAG: carboxypeptidase regulatory-like domain-containing protein [Planctomycetes bacterium]|nr:carboxypeptidase regulatory-like domain-containing protein [Planctomycetota bacterium]